MLTLAEAVAMATAHNREYQTQKELLYLAALDLTLARHEFVRRWFGTVDAVYRSEGDDEMVGGGGTLGFSRALADGAQISAGIALDWARFLTGDPRTSLGSVLNVTFTQPLLRGRGRRIAQENLTQAERDVLYQIRTFNRFRKTFVVSIVDDYYSVLALRDVVTNAENDYARRIESRERLEMEADAGQRDSFEVDQAVQNVLAAEDNVVAAQARYARALDQFRIRLSLPTDADVELDPNELEALRRIEVLEPDYPADAAIQTALSERLDLANNRDSVEDAARKVMVAADNLGADLNLVGRMGVGSTPDTDFARLQFHEGLYEVGLEADLPLDRKAERNAYRQTLIALQQQRRAYENEVDTIKLEVREAYRQLQRQAKTHQIQKNSVRLAEKRVESTSLLLEAGRVQTRDLLESQDALLEAQNSLTAALVNHTVAKLAFFSGIGLLQVQPDGMYREPEMQPRATVRDASRQVRPASQFPTPRGDVDYREFLREPERLWQSL
jgi:outer membrane protein TolC